MESNTVIVNKLLKDIEERGYTGFSLGKPFIMA